MSEKIVHIDFEELDITNDLIYTLNEAPFTGIAVEYNEQGKLISEVPLVNGVKEGIEREWYSSGQLKKEQHLKSGGGHGIFREWFETGQLKIEAHYEYAILVKKKEWDEDGKLILEKQISEKDTLYRLLEKQRKRKKLY